MSNFLDIFISFPLGFFLGILYFSSLWWTVRQLPTTQQPILLILGSFIARLSIAILGFYLVMDGRWERLVIALLGFVLARSMLIRRWRPRGISKKLINNTDYPII
ncbi:MAG: ATP synthase subunit I [Mastigocoleus sp. MO_167.B18]|uniref:ATP synthase subunit I n=1 Tax=Mastigocoleus sp. MO_188.B34 TaxID=3036635 RepID=UPI00260B8C0A|nr:ATP synthase subunit I [Mastigocoleus sp. MO_188.B34]MDJ0696902.1 ATP synthase subunit I [Mastigocoleus sp. MO_188.B34]MDJ0774760.1 ATP synthase subunit I [Mastigocoleus sp. MO_167.B18]